MHRGKEGKYIMKITTTITLEEIAKTVNIVNVDPCTHILCSAINCESCPLREPAEVLRRAQDAFLRTLDEIDVEVEDNASN